jgi:hypothetical protein
MKRTEVKNFLQAGINALDAGIAYGVGRISEFDSNRNMTYPHTWTEPIVVSTEMTEQGLPYDAWDIKLHIAKKDAMDSSPDQYETLVDECDLVAQELIKKYNDIVTGYNLVTLTGISRTPFIKKNADVLSGVILSFTLNAPDTTDLC